MQISPSTSDRAFYLTDLTGMNIGDRSIYRIELEGRPVLDVHVLHSDGRIEVTEPAPDPKAHMFPRHETNGVAKFREEMVEDADGSPVGVVRRPSGASVYRYVLPRLPYLMAKVYVTPAS